MKIIQLSKKNIEIQSKFDYPQFDYPQIWLSAHNFDPWKQNLYRLILLVAETFFRGDLNNTNIQNIKRDR